MLRRWWITGVAMGLCTSVLLAKPGIVRTLDGSTFTGDVTEDDAYATITIHGIPTKVNKQNIAKIEYTASVDDQYTARLGKLAPDDVKGRIDLANWASQNQRPDLAIAALEEAHKIEPTNRNVALLEDTAQRQLDLDRRQGGNTPGAAPATAAGGPAAPPAATNPTAVAGKSDKPQPPEYRLLNADEINSIRAAEMQADDPKVLVHFENNVVKTYLASGDHDAATFKQLRPVEQAQEILATGDPKLVKDVRIATDPTPLLQFKQKISPLVASSCGSIACHGGGTHGGDFGLYTGDSNSAVYTNYYILQTYSHSVDGVQRRMLDRTVPEQSLLLQYSLPGDQTALAHPAVPNYRPRFRSRNDPAYQEVVYWLTNSLKPIAPDYKINVSSKVPATQPADKPPAK